MLKQKGFESLGSVFIISEKELFFVLGVAHGDPILAQVGPKIVIFRDFSKKFSELLDSNYSF